MLGQVEGRRVDPHRPAQPPSGPVQTLPEPGDKVHTRLDPATERVKPKLAVIVEQAGPVQDRYCTDVPGPAEVVPQENLKL